MGACRYKANVGVTSNEEDEHSWRAKSGFNNQSAPDHGERRVYLDVDAEAGDEKITSVTDVGVDFGKAPACN